MKLTYIDIQLLTFTDIQLAVIFQLTLLQMNMKLTYIDIHLAVIVQLTLSIALHILTYIDIHLIVLVQLTLCIALHIILIRRETFSLKVPTHSHLQVNLNRSTSKSEIPGLHCVAMNTNCQIPTNKSKQKLNGFKKYSWTKQF